MAKIVIDRIRERKIAIEKSKQIKNYSEENVTQVDKKKEYPKPHSDNQKKSISHYEVKLFWGLVKIKVEPIYK